MKKRIVVTGLGVVSSIGTGKDEFWKNLIQGKSGISKVESFDTSKHFTHNGGEIKNFKPEEFMNKKKVGLIGRASQLAISAAKLALKDSHLEKKNLKNMRTAVCMGTTGGESQEIEEMDATWVNKSLEHVPSMSVIQYPVNSISSNVALELKVKGITRMFTTACAAGNYAIGYGYDLLQLGKTDIVIAGGTDAFSYLAFTGFNQLGAVAPEKCQPFDKNRKGMMVGEGAGVLVLETLESAMERNAPIYAELMDYGLSCDAYHMTNPQVEGVTKCMQNALKQSGVSSRDVDYVCAHGTGTRHNDKTEAQAINNVFSNKRVAVSSIKSMLGHTMGAASAIETIACCLALNSGIIPPTINFSEPDPECNIDCVPNAARRQELKIALNNGFAFGGNNSCLVLKKYERG
jgi:3-oxoacyl-[acyl-carrier-protein] synthase II